MKSLQGIVNCLRVVGETISKFKIAVERETGILKEANTYDWDHLLPIPSLEAIPVRIEPAGPQEWASSVVICL